MIHTTKLQPDLQNIFARAEDARLRMAHIRQQDCPRCVSYGCDTAQQCSSRGLADDGDGSPLCKWAPDAERQRAARDRTDTRASRLRNAGCKDPRLIALVADATDAPQPQPPVEGILKSMLAAESMLTENTIQTLILSGGTGVGKSCTAAWILAGSSGRAGWISAQSADSLEAWRDVEMLARDAHWLVLDDVGQERDSESHWSVDQIGGVMISRHNAGLRTVVTTNLGRRELTVRYGERWVSRMAQSGRFVDVGNQDLRRRRE